MKVWNGIARFPDDQRKVVATIGNYDGVHLGHQAILRQVVNNARERNVESLLITFEPHPLSVVAPERTPQLVQTRSQRLISLEETGLDSVLLLEFDGEMAALDGEEFFTRVLDDCMNFAAIHVGSGFRFGHGRTGDADLLARIGRERGFDVLGVPAVEIEGHTVSSSLIRRSIGEGNVERARKLLGRPFALCGEVVRGEGRGRRLRFPTANLLVENALLPSPGVYVTETIASASRYPSVTNIGTRPTFGGRTLSVESHLIDFEDDLYGVRIEVRFLARIRDEMGFANATELGDQIARDRAAAESYFQNLQLGQH